MQIISRVSRAGPARSRSFACTALVLLSLCAMTSAAADEAGRTPPVGATPIALHPDNPHYFLFRGKPTVLVGSTEHYGAVLNLDFDYVRYLDVLKSDGLNLTRTFSGYYREMPGTFGIRGNTLAPAQGRYSAPWANADGGAGGGAGGGKYDLGKWNDDHFKRMRDFVAKAGERGVVVEMSIFCPFYEQALWDIDPLNPRNNVNGVGKDVKDRKEANTLKHKDVVAVQEALARKVVTELRDFDNVYFEICNEPYFGGDDDWQRHMARMMAEAEKDLPAARRHLIARNVANGSQKVEKPDQEVSILNFHYCNPPDAVGQNWALNRAVSYDETGFRGTSDDVYRVHGWQFLLAGGAVYDNLDYSFTTSNAAGTAEVSAPGGGGPALRRQLATLRHFLEQFEFTRMKPGPSAVKGDGPGGKMPADVKVYLLAEPGRQYAAYVARVVPHKRDGKETGALDDPAAGQAARLVLDLPAGAYRAQWLDPRSGQVIRTADVTAAGRAGGAGGGAEAAGAGTTLESPPFTQDVALRVWAPAARKGP